MTATGIPEIVDSQGQRHEQLQRTANAALNGDKASEWQLTRIAARSDAEFFLNNFCTIRDYRKGIDLPFRERPAQKRLREAIQQHKLVVALKARDVGWSWGLAEFELFIKG